jgi:hypothetical protein
MKRAMAVVALISQGLPLACASTLSEMAGNVSTGSELRAMARRGGGIHAAPRLPDAASSSIAGVGQGISYVDVGNRLIATNTTIRRKPIRTRS